MATTVLRFSKRASEKVFFIGRERFLLEMSRGAPALCSNTALNQNKRKNCQSEFSRRTLYRSRQRGYLELDLLLGKWAEKNISNLDSKMMEALTVLLEEENPDLWKWLTGQLEPPQETAQNPVFIALHKEVMESLDLHSNPETRANPGAAWVRGWDDRDKRMPGVAPAGNQ